MKTKIAIVAAITLMLIYARPAHAGVIHRIGRIIRAPIFVAGLAVMTVLDVTTTPLKEAYYHYNSHPCVRW